jgi:hypothetical protein
MAPIYEPTLGEFCDILKDYSNSGIAYWKSLGGERQQDISKMFGPLIENNSLQLEFKFSKIKKKREEIFNFIPMPQPSGNDFAISFFVPSFEFLGGSRFQCSFGLVAWIDHDKGRTVAFRFEPAHADDSSHAYPHLQLTRIVKSPSHTSSFEKWMPQSYPAFPFGLSSPVEFFAAVAVAVHGYSRAHRALYVAEAVGAAMKAGNSALRGKRVVDEIHRLFG